MSQEALIAKLKELGFYGPGDTLSSAMDKALSTLVGRLTSAGAIGGAFGFADPGYDPKKGYTKELGEKLKEIVVYVNEKYPDNVPAEYKSLFANPDSLLGLANSAYDADPNAFKPGAKSPPPTKPVNPTDSGKFGPPSAPPKKQPNLAAFDGSVTGFYHDEKNFKDKDRIPLMKAVAAAGYGDVSTAAGKIFEHNAANMKGATPFEKHNWLMKLPASVFEENDFWKKHKDIIIEYQKYAKSKGIERIFTVEDAEKVARDDLRYSSNKFSVTSQTPSLDSALLNMAVANGVISPLSQVRSSQDLNKAKDYVLKVTDFSKWKPEDAAIAKAYQVSVGSALAYRSLMATDAWIAKPKLNVSNANRDAGGGGGGGATTEVKLSAPQVTAVKTIEKALGQTEDGTADEATQKALADKIIAIKKAAGVETPDGTVTADFLKLCATDEKYKKAVEAEKAGELIKGLTEFQKQKGDFSAFTPKPVDTGAGNNAGGSLVDQLNARTGDYTNPAKLAGAVTAAQTGLSMVQPALKKAIEDGAGLPKGFELIGSLLIEANDPVAFQKSADANGLKGNENFQKAMQQMVSLVGNKVGGVANDGVYTPEIGKKILEAVDKNPKVLEKLMPGVKEDQGKKAILEFIHSMNILHANGVLGQTNLNAPSLVKLSEVGHMILDLVYSIHPGFGRMIHGFAEKALGVKIDRGDRKDVDVSSPEKIAAQINKIYDEAFTKHQKDGGTMDKDAFNKSVTGQWAAYIATQMPGVDAARIEKIVQDSLAKDGALQADGKPLTKEQIAERMQKITEQLEAERANSPAPGGGGDRGYNPQQELQEDGDGTTGPTRGGPNANGGVERRNLNNGNNVNATNGKPDPAFADIYDDVVAKRQAKIERGQTGLSGGRPIPEMKINKQGEIEKIEVKYTGPGGQVMKVDVTNDVAWYFRDGYMSDKLRSVLGPYVTQRADATTYQNLMDGMHMDMQAAYYKKQTGVGDGKLGFWESFNFSVHKMPRKGCGCGTDNCAHMNISVDDAIKKMNVPPAPRNTANNNVGAGPNNGGANNGTIEPCKVLPNGDKDCGPVTDEDLRRTDDNGNKVIWFKKNVDDVTVPNGSNGQGNGGGTAPKADEVNVPNGGTSSKSVPVTVPVPGK